MQTCQGHGGPVPSFDQDVHGKGIELYFSEARGKFDLVQIQQCKGVFQQGGCTDSANMTSKLNGKPKTTNGGDVFQSVDHAR